LLIFFFHLRSLSFIDIATCAIVGENVPEPVDLMLEKRDYVAIKVPQFSWTRLAGADPFLGVGESLFLLRDYFLSSRGHYSAVMLGGIWLYDFLCFMLYAQTRF